MFFLRHASSASRVARAVPSEMAGVIPVTWNHSVPSRMTSQSNSPGMLSAMAEWFLS